MSAKKKICIFIENDFILRSYLEAFTIQKMSNEYSIELILTYRTNSDVFGEEFTFPIKFIQKSQFHQFLQTVFSITYWFRKQNLSNSFATRILSLKFSRRIYYSKSKNRTFPSLSIVAGIIFAKSKVEIPQNFYSMASKKFRKFLEESKPNLVICITSGAATSNSDLLSFAGRNLKIPVFTIVENWDNLTSKAVFNVKPDYVGVWGAQDKQYAMNLHDISESRIFLLGSPRVSKLLNSKQMQLPKGRKLLFAGGSIDIDDELLWLNSILEYTSLHSIQVIYVPHPSNYNGLAILITNSNMNLVELIPQEIMDLILEKSSKRYPRLNFYEEILRESRVAISPYSTLLLESLLYGIPGVGIDFQDPYQAAVGWASEKFEHFAHLNYFTDYYRVLNVNQIIEVLDKFFVQKDFISDTDDGAKRLLSQNPFYNISNDFNEQMMRIVKKVIS